MTFREPNADSLVTLPLSGAPRAPFGEHHTSSAPNGAARPPLTAEERTRFERHISEIFARLGMSAGPGTSRTPRRWLEAMVDMTAGYEGDPKVATLFPGECATCLDEELEQIVEGPISFFALCEHHALPIQGKAWVGYLPAHEILGISKLTRIVRLYARRFTTQERILHQVADHIMTAVKPRGVAVLLDAHHACTQARGVREPESRTRIHAVRGTYTTDHGLREEFLRLAGLATAAT